MGELLREAIEWQNLPLTVLMGLVVVYWLIVAIGLADTDSLDVDMDTDVDVDMDVDVDAEFDADLDIAGAHHGHDFDVELDADTGHGGGLGDVGVAYMRFVNIGEVPLTVVISVMAVCLWLVSVVSNHYLNPAGGVLIAAGLFLGNFVLSTLMTRLLTTPFKPLMRALKKDSGDAEEVLGQVGQALTGEITDDFGQVEVLVGGTPFTLQARLAAGSDPVERGDRVMVVHREHEDTQIFRVRKLEAAPNEPEKTHEGH